MIYRFKILQVILKNGVLLPIGENDAALLDDFKEKQIFDLRAVSNRSNPHHSLYWATLSNVVKATAKWPSKNHLHSDLKMLCGYYRSVINGLTGQIYYVPDSISFEKMDQKEFMTFFENAMEKLSEAIGYDPL